MRTLELAGNDITIRLRDLLSNGQYRFKNSLADNELVSYLKESLCAVKADEEIGAKPITLPDGRTIELKDERHEAPEILFTPTVDPSHMLKQSTQDIVYESISDCQNEMRRELYQSIVLSGGSTQLPGF